MKKKNRYIQPIIITEWIEDDELMISTSHTTTEDFTEDPAPFYNDDIPVHENPLETTDPFPVDDGGDY